MIRLYYREMISAIVLSHNSQASIKHCLAGLNFCSEIIVIDDHSSDKTVVMAQKAGAKVRSRQLNGDFAAQRNFGLTKAAGDWVLFIDSDEIIDRDLRFEIVKKIGNCSDNIQGFYLKRKDRFLGKWLSHGETGQIKLLRLGKKNAGKWQGKVHETWLIRGKKASLKAPLLHQRQLTVAQFMTRLQNYAQVRAKELYGGGVKENWLMMWIKPISKFIENYVLRLGFLDGAPGLAMAYLMSWHSLLVRLWLKLYWRNHGQEVFKVQ